MTAAGDVSPGTRRAALAAALSELDSRVAAACTSAGRDRSTVTTIVVTKTFPSSDVRLLAQLGVRDVGESRDQEAHAKVEELRARSDDGGRQVDLRWHFVGRLQTNKAASVATYADVVHSVDRDRLVTALARGAAAAGRVVPCLVQVSLDADPGRGGAPPQEVLRLADLVEAADGLTLRGLMAVAPMGRDPGAAFAELALLHERLRRSHPAATWLSAGMSADLEEAVAHGATHLRVGRAVLGSRPPLG